VSNAISNGTALTKNGAGTLTLSGANTYTGGTTVTGGRLIATSGSALGSGSLTVAADKTFSYRPNAAGPLTIGGTLNLGNGTTTNIGTAVGGGVNQSRIDVTGSATLLGTGVVDVNFISGVAPTPGTNQLITAASGLDGGTYTLGTVFNNSDYTVTNFQRTGIAISVDVATATALSGNVLWKGGLAGNTGVWAASTGLSGGASNWQVTNGVDQPLVPGATADLVFSAANSPGTMAGMTLGADMTLQSLTINNTATAFGLGADGYTLTLTPATPAGGLTLNTGVLASTIGANVALGADQTWTNNSTNTLTVSGVVSGGFSLTKAGTGTISLTGANTYIGTTVINGGTLTVTGSLNGTTGTALTFGGSGTLNVAEPANSAQGMGALTLGAGDGAVTSTAAGATSIATLTFGSLSARSAGATANLTLAANTSSISATPNKIVFTDTTNVPLAGGSNDPGIFFGGANYARYDAAGFVRAVAYGSDNEAPAALTGPGVTTLGDTTVATDVQFTGSARATTTSGVVSAANTNTLTVTDGSLFAVGQILTGTNIAANTYITAITGNTLTLTNANVANSIGTAVPAATVLTPYNSVTAQTTGSVNTLNLSGVGASLTLGSSETLSINGILRSAGTAVASSVISGGTGLQAAASGGEMVVRANLTTDVLTIATPILDNAVSRLT
jgi:autotransporter-associated beta strand protein